MPFSLNIFFGLFFSTIIVWIFLLIFVIKQKNPSTRIFITIFSISAIGVFLLAETIMLSETFSEKLLEGLFLLIFLVISVILIKNIRDETAYYERLQSTNAKLERAYLTMHDKNEEMKDIVDIFGHELKTPFTSIKQEASYLLEIFVGKTKEKLLKGQLNTIDAQDLMEGLETINIAASQGIEETITMLEAARLDKSLLELKYTKFDLVQAIKEILQITRKQLNQKKYKIILKTSDPVVNVRMDRVRIQEAIFALLSNAKKYGVNTHKKTSKIELSIKRIKSWIEIQVADQGEGINPSDINKLGKKFKRLHHKTASGLARPGGTGLGLFVVKGIVNNHQGKLIIKSKGVGQGASFTLRLPIKQF